MNITDLKLTLLFDNVTCDTRLNNLWGFSCLVETPHTRLLFDSGSNGRILLRNMKTLGIYPEMLDQVFISHNHWDHIGGIDSLLELNPTLEVIVPSSLSPRLVNDLGTLCRQLTQIDEGPSQIGPGLSSTGTLPGDDPEQALIITSNQGLIVITGCAHPGITTIAERATMLADETVTLLAGGFHLFQASPLNIDLVASQLQALGVRYLMPSHCTGESATLQLQNIFSGSVISGGAGQTISFDKNGRPLVTTDCNHTNELPC